MWENVSSVVRPSKTPISMHIRLDCLHEVTLHPRLSEIRTAKILIRLRKCAYLSVPSLDAHVRMYAFWRYGS